MELSRDHELSRALKMPVWAKDTSPREKIGNLEDHVVITAHYQGLLSSERLDCHVELHALQGEWAHLAGWEPLRKGKTDSSIEEAKRELRPDLWDRISDCKWKIARLSEEIQRLDGEFTKASRVYTFLSGA